MGNSRRDLANLDPDIGQDWSRIIQDAFKNGLELSCDLIFGERLADRPEQGVYVASETQNYVLGTRRVTPDGRVFRYGRCNQTLDRMNSGVKNYSSLVTRKASICLATDADSKTVEVTTATFLKTLEADELKGGYISLYRDADRAQRHIVGNTAIPVIGGANCMLTLKDALTVGLNLNDPCEILPNPYGNLRWGNHNYSSVMGMPCVMAKNGEYFWIQTWGPCRISPIGTAFGVNQNEQLFGFSSNGGLERMDTLFASSYDKQIAGFVIEMPDALEEEAAAPFIMLQISP
ncbi:hypothetical protein ES703_12003 [subsurface metagenome]